MPRVHQGIMSAIAFTRGLPDSPNVETEGRNVTCGTCHNRFTFDEDGRENRGNGEPRTLKCGHNVCGSCLVKAFKSRRKISCPRRSSGRCQQEFDVVDPTVFHVNPLTVGRIFVADAARREQVRRDEATRRNPRSGTPVGEELEVESEVPGEDQSQPLGETGETSGGSSTSLSSSSSSCSYSFIGAESAEEEEEEGGGGSKQHGDSIDRDKFFKELGCAIKCCEKSLEIGRRARESFSAEVNESLTEVAEDNDALFGRMMAAEIADAKTVIGERERLVRCVEDMEREVHRHLERMRVKFSKLEETGEAPKRHWLVADLDAAIRLQLPTSFLQIVHQDAGGCPRDLPVSRVVKKTGMIRPKLLPYKSAKMAMWSDFQPIVEEPNSPASLQKEGSIPRELLAVNPFKAVPVRVLHVVSPSEFYVVRRETDYMERVWKIDRKTKGYGKALEESKDFRPGRLILCREEDRSDALGCGLWLRAELEAFGDDQAAEAMLLDLGRPGRVSLAETKAVPASLLSIPILVKKCCLVEVVSAETGGHWWPQRAIDDFKKILKKESFRLAVFIRSIQNAILHKVDMVLVPPKDVEGEPHTSIGQALVFLGHAKKSETAAKTGDWDERCEYVEIKDGTFAKGTKQLCKVVAAPSEAAEPGLITLEVLGEQETYLQRVREISDQMSLVYGGPSGEMYTIYCPRPMQPCGIILDEAVVRGKILSVTDGEPDQVRVLSVDDGREMTVPLEKLRLLPSHLMVQHLLGVTVELSNLAPPNPSSGEDGLPVWNQTSTNAITTFLSNKSRLIAYVDDCVRRPGRVHRSVTLYEDHPKKLVCLNALLVRLGLARPFPDDHPGVPSVVEYFKCDPVAFMRDLGHLEELSPYTFDVTCDPSEYDQDCHVLRVDSPDQIYLSTEERRPYEEMQREMDEHYGEGVGKQDVFQVEEGRECAYYFDGKWRRGVIETAGDQDKLELEVRLLDEGEVVVGCVEQLRPLEEKFCKLNPRGFYCSLDGVRPPEEEDGKWSAESRRVLKELLGKGASCKYKEHGEKIEASGFRPRVASGSIGVLAEKTETALSLDQAVVIDAEKYLVTARLARPIASAGRVVVTTLKRWLPAALPADSEVAGLLRYVHAGDDYSRLTFYLSEAGETLDDMRIRATNAFRNSQPKPQDLFWYEGQPCLVQFWWDKMWYRGEVRKVLGGKKYEVKLIDYGTMVMVEGDQLRKNLLEMTDIPAQALEATVATVSPKGGKKRWNAKTVLQIHQLLADKVLKVAKFAPAKTWPLVGKVTTVDGANVADILAFHRLAEKKREN